MLKKLLLLAVNPYSTTLGKMLIIAILGKVLVLGSE